MKAVRALDKLRVTTSITSCYIFFCSCLNSVILQSIQWSVLRDTKEHMTPEHITPHCTLLTRALLHEFLFLLLISALPSPPMSLPCLVPPHPYPDALGPCPTPPSIGSVRDSLSRPPSPLPEFGSIPQQFNLV